MSGSDPKLQEIVARLLALPRQQWELVRARHELSDNQWKEILRRLDYAQAETWPLDEQPPLALVARRMSDEAEAANVIADLAPRRAARTTEFSSGLAKVAGGRLQGRAAPTRDGRCGDQDDHGGRRHARGRCPLRIRTPGAWPGWITRTSPGF